MIFRECSAYERALGYSCHDLWLLEADAKCKIIVAQLVYTLQYPVHFNFKINCYIYNYTGQACNVARQYKIVFKTRPVDHTQCMLLHINMYEGCCNIYVTVT